jgi:hypothetical protein
MLPGIMRNGNDHISNCLTITDVILLLPRTKTANKILFRGHIGPRNLIRLAPEEQRLIRIQHTGNTCGHQAGEGGCNKRTYSHP